MKSTEMCGRKNLRGLNSFSIRSGAVLLVITAFAGSFYFWQRQPQHSGAQLGQISGVATRVPPSSAPFSSTKQANRQTPRSVMLELPLSFEQSTEANEFLARG